jgi:hypothetical protein
MAKQYYAIHYTSEGILEAARNDGWTITPSDEIFLDKPIAYELRRTPTAATYVSLYPGVRGGTPMFDMRRASADDGDLLDQFKAIHENDYFSS